MLRNDHCLHSSNVSDQTWQKSEFSKSFICIGSCLKTDAPSMSNETLLVDHFRFRGQLHFYNGPGWKTTFENGTLSNIDTF